MNEKTRFLIQQNNVLNECRRIINRDLNIIQAQIFLELVAQDLDTERQKQNIDIAYITKRFNTSVSAASRHLRMLTTHSCNSACYDNTGNIQYYERTGYGLCDFEIDTEDKRRKRLILTEKGRKIAKTIATLLE